MQLDRLASKPQRRFCFYLCGTAITGAYCHALVFVWVLGTELGLHVFRTSLYRLNYLCSPWG